MNTITIEFQRDEDMHRFVSYYRGDFLAHHPNYDGVVTPDHICGSWTPLAHLDRTHIKNFQIFLQDVTMFNGKIRL